MVEIEISLHDILYALKLSGGLHGKLAMVAYANIAISAQILCDLLNYQVEIFTVKSIEELEPTLRHLKDAQYDTVLCDMTADIIAKILGSTPFSSPPGLRASGRLWTGPSPFAGVGNTCKMKMRCSAPCSAAGYPSGRI